MHIGNRVELRWHALARPHEVLGFIEHDDQRLGRPELVEEPEDGASGVEGLRVRPRVREQISLPHAPPTGDQRETWARTIKELAQLRLLMLAGCRRIIPV